jgi:hypothetical protein
VVLLDAPLGTYHGWNITAAGFHKEQICNYAGGMIPFARTLEERTAKQDPRPSLQERYTTMQARLKRCEGPSSKLSEKVFSCHRMARS